MHDAHKHKVSPMAESATSSVPSSGTLVIAIPLSPHRHSVDIIEADADTSNDFAVRQFIQCGAEQLHVVVDHRIGMSDAS